MNPFKKKKPESGNSNAIILDTCALIDGRIIPIAKAGFAPSKLIIPQFVIAELQFLADRGDSQKRERARFGLDVIRDLQDLRRTTVVIAREQFKDIKEVDDKLIALGKQYNAKLYTTDYNLNKVAQIEGITVLNVNELAQALRPPRLPGEQVELKITQVGQDRTQGVGYLEDGTMVVVEKAGKLVGQRIRVEFSRILQTQAGKMMFAVLPHAHQPQVAATPMPVTAQPPAPTPTAVYHAAPRANRPPRPVRQPQAPVSSVQPDSKPAQAPVRPAKPKSSAGAPRGRNNNRRRQTPEDSLIAAIEKQR